MQYTLRYASLTYMLCAHQGVVHTAAVEREREDSDQGFASTSHNSLR